MNTYLYTQSKILRKALASLFILSISFSGCQDFLDIASPKTDIVPETVFSTDASATSTVRGIYSLMMTNQSFTNGGIEEFTGILSDELINYATRQDQIEFYQNSLSTKNGIVAGPFWREPFKYINNANAILEGLENTQSLSSATKNQLKGEAKFIRAFCYLYLAELFGDIPYITSTDYRLTASAPRATQNDVYQKIERDLLDAAGLLAADFSFSNDERVQPNQGAAYALLARLYLYTENWSGAEEYSTRLITKTDVYSLAQVNDVFLKASKEAIWQLKPVVPNANSPQGQLFILLGAPNSSSRRVSLSTKMIEAFEDGDERRNAWVGVFANGSGSWYYPAKYKIASNSTVTEYNTVLRLAEQYLIRAEARAHLGDIAGAQADLTAIRERAGLSPTSASDTGSLLAAIEAERRIELFAEWGHRWIDLVRTNRATAVLGGLKIDWQETDVLFPIPESERLLNPNLSQNDGY